MAIWQYAFSLVPAAGIERLHGNDVRVLAAHQVSGEDGLPRILDTPAPDYWGGAGIPQDAIDAIDAMFGRRASWSDDAQMFGESNSNSVEVWRDDISVELDVTRLSLQHIVFVLELAAKLDCRLVESGSGEIFDADGPALAERIRSSRAFRFCQDPHAALRELSSGRR